MIDKASSARAIMRDINGTEECDFLLCIGDGKTDEVVFQYLGEIDNAMTCTVGKKQTEAKTYLDSVRDVEKLLAQLCQED